jgi:hypothetical protein
MARAYEEAMETLQRKREALLDVPEQLARALEQLADISASLTMTLERFSPVERRRVFLSHRSTDKATVRRFRSVLAAIGFEPWFDDDQMPAGTALDRAILDGMKESCAAVFFITSHFEDSRFISQEVDYAIMQYRERPRDFAIIPILFGESPDAIVPDLLRRFVIKRVSNDMDALLCILRGLPIKPGPPVARVQDNHSE